jgi:hypothetical protein
MVSIPKIGMFGTAQFVQNPCESINTQVTIAASTGISDRKIYTAQPLIFPEGILNLEIEDRDYPSRILYLASLKLNFCFDREVRRECYQSLTITRNPRGCDYW